MPRKRRDNETIDGGGEPFTESQPLAEDDVATPRKRRNKRIVLILNEERSAVDWDKTPDGARADFISILETDSELQSVAAGAAQGANKAAEGIADTTVLAAVNAVMAAEAVTLSVVGPRVLPVMRNLPLPVAIKACSVSLAELQPVMEPAKRIVHKLTPSSLLKYQDFIVVGEHLAKISVVKFQECLKLAMAIEEMRQTPMRNVSTPPTPRNVENGAAPNNAPRSTSENGNDTQAAIA